ncbi:MAG: hypothetical protein QXK94_08830 [Candidatus Jordarchaeales archaeon]
MVEIFSVPFVLQRREFFPSKYADAVEVALAFFLIWKKSSGGELVSVSKFFFPIHLIPVDGESMVAVEATASLSGSVFYSPHLSSFKDFDEARLESFTEALKLRVSSLKRQVKPLKANVPGLVSGPALTALTERLQHVERWNVKPDELVPERISLKAASETLSSFTVLTKENVNHFAEVFRENLRIIDETLARYREEIEEAERKAEEEKQRIKEKAQGRVEEERAKFEMEVKRIEALKFSESPPSTFPLSRYIEKLEKAISEATSGGEPELTLERIRAVIDSLEEAIEEFSRVEREYLNYLGRRERFEREKERLKKKAEKEFQKEEERILKELEREIEDVNQEVRRVKQVFLEAVRQKREYEEISREWLSQARSRVEANSSFLAPASTFPGKLPATVYVPFFAYRLAGGKEVVDVIPPIVVEAGGVAVSSQLESIVSLSLREEVWGAIASGLKKFNYLLNPEAASLFSRGISVLVDSGVLRRREADEAKSYIDHYLKPAVDI